MGGRRRGTLYRLEVIPDQAAAVSHAHQVPTVRVGLLGCGNVGGALAEILLTRSDDVAARTGIRLELVGIAVANADRPRPAAIPAELIGTDAAALVERADVAVVVEVIGGIHPADEFDRVRPAQREARGHRQ